MERGLKWVSFLILLYFGISFLIGAAGTLLEGFYWDNALLSIAFLLPCALFTMTSYRQIAKPQFKLVILCSLLYAIFCVGMILFWMSNVDEYEKLRETFVSSTTTVEEAELVDSVFPIISFRDLLYLSIAHLALLIIPLYSNFKRHRDS